MRGESAIWPGQTRRSLVVVTSNGARHLFGLVFGLGHLLFNSLDFDALAFYVKAEPSKKAHVLVGDPDQGKAPNQVSTPIVIQQLVPCDEQEKYRHIVAETIFTGEEIKKL